MGALQVRESLFVRMLRGLKLLQTVDAPMLTDVNAGLDYGQPFSTAPGFPPIDSLSAIAVDPWIYAAATTVALDMAGIPLKVRRGDGADALVLDDHPVLELLRYPSSRMPASQFHAQLWLDLIATGIFFVLVLRDNRKKPVGLIRLHPERCRILADKTSQIEAVEYEAGDERIRYAWEDILVGSLPSWEEGPQGLYGTGAIRSLKDDIESSIQLKKRTKESARKGRPDFLATPKVPEISASASQRDGIQRELNRRLKDLDAGVWVTPPDMDITVLTQTLKDLQGSEQLDRIRQGVMAVFHVPPIKLGLETANYATSNNQLVEYWTHYLLVSCIPAWQFSRLAKELGHPTDEVYFDGSGIDAFQEMRTARLVRVQQHVALGMTETDAYAYEGMEDAPIEDAIPATVAPPSPAPVTAVPPPVDGADSSRTYRLGGPLTAADIKGWLATKGAVQYKAPDGPDERDRAWSDWNEKAATPGEQVLTFVVAKILKAQRIRIQKRLAQALHREGMKATGTDGITVKAPPEDIVAEIISSPAEIEAITKDMSPALRRIIELAFKRTKAQLGFSNLTFDPDLSEHAAFAEKMAEHIQAMTAEGVKDIVKTGLDEGKTISEMQKDLTQAYAFSPSRARAIARTESTQALNAGAVQAMTQAEAEGVSFRGKMWLSSRDEAVRDTHVTLDGQVVPLDGQWESSGAKADHPGGFGIAAEDINCRCTVVPVLD